MSGNDQNLINNSEKSNPTTDSCVDIQISSLEFNLFFDGTWNSKENSDWYNIEAPKQHGEHSSKRNQARYNPSRFFGAIDSLSFARAPTGVDRMHRAMRTDEPHRYGLYVDGAGITTRTPNHKNPQDPWKYHADNPYGAGIGLGDTGVYAKLKMMLKQIKAKLDTYICQQDKPSILIFNVYGFSRGAATARIFCNWIFSQSKQDFVKEHLDIAGYVIQFNFIGLFDTVSSIGTDHTDDVQEESLWLDFDKRTVGKVIHIAAEHEYRQKFNLVNIKSMAQKGVGLEFSLPGCHTDIGDGLSTLGEVSKNSTEWYVSGRDDSSDGKGQRILSKERKPIYDRQTGRFSHYEDASDGDAKNVEHLSWFRRLVSPSVLEYQQIAKQGQNHADIMALKKRLIEQGWAVNPPGAQAYHCTGRTCTPQNCFVKAEQSKTDTTQSTAQAELYVHCTGDKTHLVLNRKQVSLDYPKIPTHIMIYFIKKYGAYRLDDNELKQYAIKNTTDSPELEMLYDQLSAQAFALDDKPNPNFIDNNRDNQGANPNRLNIAQAALRKKMYNRYLHFSSSNGGIIPVSIANFNHKTNDYYRDVVEG